MKPYPDWMDKAGLMAKSVERGGETLVQHTIDVLFRLSDLVRLHGILAKTDSRIWNRMYWGCLLHDFGKVASGFQDMLQGEKNLWVEYKQRHEILSLAFVDWLFPQGHVDRDWVIAIIAFHHRDAETIFTYYGGEQPIAQTSDAVRETAKRMLTHLQEQVDRDTKMLLWRWLKECSHNWAQTIGIKLLDPKPHLVSIEEIHSYSIAKSTYKTLRDFSEWRKQLSAEEKICAYLCRGLILTADHCASAHTGTFPDMPLDMSIAREPVKKFTKLRNHQERAIVASFGSVIMIAPTGSGKTEAAMLWAARQIELRPASRLFYTLPYQASMNAMADRLWRKYFYKEGQSPKLAHTDNQAVTIQHSRARLRFYQIMMDAEATSAKDAEKQAKWLQNLARLNYFPIQVFSPYQMLKAAYSLKGYESLLVDYSNALFIFDEIHAYEPKRMALIITMIQWLRENFGARFLVMTATLPPMVRDKLQVALGNPEIIEADVALYEQSRRHEVHILDGRLEQSLDLILQQYQQGERVLVCCNQIKRAQAVYDYLQEYVADPQEDMLLLHGRFNGGDRRKKEERLRQVTAVGQAEKRERGFIAVATQAVEVSLDIDMDCLYTEPAPLEAMLQRFGRVNRGRNTKVLQPVHVFREPVSGDDVRPYTEKDVVKRSVEVLESFTRVNPAIDEAQVNDMLAEIYQGEIQVQWLEKYEKVAEEFQRVILGQMKAYQSANRDMWENFYKMFDGIDVLPKCHLDDFQELHKTKGFLDATRYVVSISQMRYHILRNNYRIWEEGEDNIFPVIDIPYSEETGLMLDIDYGG